MIVSNATEQLGHASPDEPDSRFPVSSRFDKPDSGVKVPDASRRIFWQHLS